MIINARFRLSTRNATRYLADCDLLHPGEKIEVRELGGGVSNTVILIAWPQNPQKRWVVKQSLGKLRVKDEWRSDRARIFNEAECMKTLGALLGSGVVPEVVWVDRPNFLMIMTAAPPGSSVWKDLLLAGQVEATIAGEAGRLLALVMAASQRDASLRQAFEDRTVFDQLRIDPYYRTVAARCPDVAPVIQELISDSWRIRTSLTHGDYSPKNMLVRDGKIFLIDFEVAHWGDPAFDSAFLLNHLFLKAFHSPQRLAFFVEAARQFWGSLTSTLKDTNTEAFEEMTVRHLGALMLARIDGKSPVEYLKDEPVKNRVRHTARHILLECPLHLEDVIEIVREENAGSN
ncbi:MAG: aminoglycoside phosphotransferase family protein [Terriglobia bacterium]